MSLIRVLAKVVVEMDFAKLPPAVVEQAKKCILDYMGNMIGGRYTKKGETIVNYAASLPCATDATIIGHGKVAREIAAFTNAALSRMLDLDDGHRFAMGHPACVLVPTALAVGEYLEASGPEIIHAIVAGYEVYVRIGSTFNPSSYIEKGFDTTGVCGAVAVAAVAAKLYKLDEEQAKDALGLAAVHAGGLIEYFSDGSSGKYLCPGWATSTGIKAAELAQRGFTGPETVLEGNKGYLQAFSNKYDVTRITDRPANDYGILQNYFKIHACVRRLHPAVDAMLALRSKFALNPGKVKAITVKAGTFVSQANKLHPQALTAAQVSLPFVLAVALTHGRVDESSLVQSINDNGIGEIEKKITIIADPKVQEYAAANPSNWGAVEVEVLTVDSRRESQWVPLAFGEPEAPLSWKMLEDKFAHLISPTKFAEVTDQIINSVKQIDRYQKINEFTEGLKVPGQA